MIGCGDIGIRLANELTEEQLVHNESTSKNNYPKNTETLNTIELYGLRRHIDLLPESIQGITCDLNTITDLKECFESSSINYDIVVITLVPNERSDEGYRRAYVENLEKIINGLESATIPPKHIFMVSSTSVYGQQEEQWVDETSETEPTHYSGRRVLQGEQRLAKSDIPSTIIRFSGIYGPGRLRIIEQVRNGEWISEGGSESESEREARNSHSGFSNRIHADDCAGVLAHLIKKQRLGERLGERLDSCYLATDCEPVRLNEVKQWIAAQLGITQSNNEIKEFLGDKKVSTMRRNSKRCLNKKILESGYQFKYPTFREGYGQVILGMKNNEDFIEK